MKDFRDRKLSAAEKNSTIDPSKCPSMIKSMDDDTSEDTSNGVDDDGVKARNDIKPMKKPLSL